MAYAIVFDDYRWRVVPLEPSPEQVEEARKYMVTAADIDEVKRIYRAMVATAPPCPRLPFTGPRPREEWEM